MLMTIAPWWVPALIASNAPFRVLNEPEAVAELAVRVTCEFTVSEQHSRRMIRDVLTGKLLNSIISLVVTTSKV
jgi:hypothetical protein